MYLRTRALLVAALWVAAGVTGAQADMGTAFTYQGYLEQNNEPANVTASMNFRLFDVETGGSPLVQVNLAGVVVEKGQFTVELDFGPGYFDGGARWLEIIVEGTNLTPRQALKPAPYALTAETLVVPVELASDAAATLTVRGSALSGNVLDVFADSGSSAIRAQHLVSGAIVKLATAASGVWSRVQSGQGVVGTHENSGNTGWLGSSASGVYGKHEASGHYGYVGSADAGIYGHTDSNYALFGEALGNNTTAVFGYHHAGGNGVMGQSGSGPGVYGVSQSGPSVMAYNLTSKHVARLATLDYGVYGENATGYAGYFAGDVNVTEDAHFGGKVGIGTNSPLEALDVSGNVRMAGTEPGLVLHDTNAAGSKPFIRFENTDLLSFIGDDDGNERVGFYSAFTKDRMNDAVVQIYGKSTSTWGNYLELKHDGLDGLISTDTGNLILTPAANVGIGTASPAQKLTVAGTVHSTTGGFKFPDGTVQTTAAATGGFTLPYSGTYAGSDSAFEISSSGTGRTMWLSRTNTGGGNSTLRADNQGDFAAMYAYGVTAQSWGLRAYHATTGHVADLATADYAGNFQGDVLVSGEIWKRYAPNTRDPAAPLAYAFVMSNGAIMANTPNVANCVWNSTYGRYEITIAGESYYYTDYVTVVSPASSLIAHVASISGKLLVYTRNSAGDPVQGSFQFITYKPNGGSFGDRPVSPDPSMTDAEWAEQAGYTAEFVHEVDAERPAARPSPGSDAAEY